MITGREDPRRWKRPIFHEAYMVATNEFIIDLAHALANLVLTRRPEVRVTRIKDNGYLDLMAEIIHENPKNGLTSIFCPFYCIVHGTSEQLADVGHASRHCDASFWNRPDRLRFCSPVLFLLFSMVDDRGYHGWYAEPKLDESESPVLVHPEKVKLAAIRRNSLDTIVESVATWYEALSESLVRDEPMVKTGRKVSHA